MVVVRPAPHFMKRMHGRSTQLDSVSADRQEVSEREGEQPAILWGAVAGTNDKSQSSLERKKKKDIGLDLR